jgi:uncharacterized protein (DUF427 family)
MDVRYLIRIEINGIEIANTRAPRLLFETGLPVRAYIPKTDCRMDLWTPSTHTTGCPYKVRAYRTGLAVPPYATCVLQGIANYYNIVLSSGDTFENILWWYQNPTVECSAIQGFVAFFDERLDVFVDGEKQERPASGLYIL